MIYRERNKVDSANTRINISVMKEKIMANKKFKNVKMNNIINHRILIHYIKVFGKQQVKMKKLLMIQLFIITAFGFCSIVTAASVSIEKKENIPQVVFAIEKVRQAIDAKGFSTVPEKGEFQVKIIVKADGKIPESFSITRENKTLPEQCMADLNWQN